MLRYFESHISPLVRGWESWQRTWTGTSQKSIINIWKGTQAFGNRKIWLKTIGDTTTHPHRTAKKIFFKWQHQGLARIWNNGNSHTILMEANHAISLKNCLAVSPKTKYVQKLWASNCTCMYYTRKKSPYVQQNTGTKVLSTALLVKAPN